MKLPPYVKMVTAPSSVIGRFSLALLVISALKLKAGKIYQNVHVVHG
jgi:hypothetical protein